ncbi:alpha/beta hydrolase family protein [Nonomuraea sp. NPDC050536]|uniref:alpha/beta hydrolase family protein n=1 Tax=Nonomuraea sp. NPDC050536 TaxID=3364366 RepID=UPI0037C755CD
MLRERNPALLVAALTLVSAAYVPAASAVAAAAPAAKAPASVSSVSAGELPRPTGSHGVGRSTLHLVDKHRRDPWVPKSGDRQLMVSMYYPAKPGTGEPARYMTVEEARLMLQRRSPGAKIPPEALSDTRTYAREGARPSGGHYPLVVLSPGFTFPRASLTAVAEDLASRGYVVALVDHTYESSGVTFPDGRTLPCADVCDHPPAGGLAAISRSRAADIHFVLDQLTGRRPGWPYARMIDRKRIGMAGHSIGGDAAASTMAADDRVRAGVNMDGTFFDPMPAAGLHGRPFLLLGTRSEHAPGKDDSWDSGWKHLDGWKRWLTIAGSDHGTFTDVPTLAAQAGLPSPAGAIPPLRGLELTRTYVAAFFDMSLKGGKQPLPENPEVAFHNP